MNHLRDRWHFLAWREQETFRGYPLPQGGQFGQTKSFLDPDIFDKHDVMHPWLKYTFESILDVFWGMRYGVDWREWTRLYLAGSLASYWFGTPDMDMLIGVKTTEFIKRHPKFIGMADAEVCKYLTNELIKELDPYTASFSYPPHGDIWHLIESLLPQRMQKLLDSTLMNDGLLGKSARSLGLNETPLSIDWIRQVYNEIPSSVEKYGHQNGGVKNAAKMMFDFSQIMKQNAGNVGLVQKNGHLSGSYNENTVLTLRNISDYLESKTASVTSVASLGHLMTKAQTLTKSLLSIIATNPVKSGDFYVLAVTTDLAILTTTLRNLKESWPTSPNSLENVETTFYVNSASWDIRAIKPYAAYEIISGKWYVHPIQIGKNWGAHDLDHAFWSHMADTADEIKAVLSLRDAQEKQARALEIYDKIHSDRGAAFSATGHGLTDKRSLQWVVLNRWGLLGPLEVAAHPDRPMAHLPPAIASKYWVEASKDLRTKIQDALTDDLRKKQYQGNPNPHAGHCYVASEAYYHLRGGTDSGLKPMQVNHEGESHWFLKDKNSGENVDLTSSQFKTPVPYDKAVGKGFLTKQPSQRAQELMRRVS